MAGFVETVKLVGAIFAIATALFIFYDRLFRDRPIFALQAKRPPRFRQWTRKRRLRHDQSVTDKYAPINASWTGCLTGGPAVRLCPIGSNTITGRPPAMMWSRRSCLKFVGRLERHTNPVGTEGVVARLGGAIVHIGTGSRPQCPITRAESDAELVSDEIG